MACQGEREQGAVLIIVLFFCLITVMLAAVILESSALQVKMLNHYRDKMQIDLQIEKRILELENELKINKKGVLPKEITFLQFVPDTLLLGEKEGTDYYRIQVGAVSTTFAVCHTAEATLLDDPLQSVVDLNGNGVADFIYIRNEKGQLWKVNVQSPLEEGHFASLEGKIKGKILVGHHPKGKGVLIYVWGEKTEGQPVIYALWDTLTEREIFSYFKIEEKIVDQPLLRQGYLVVPVQGGETKIYDAFSGKAVPMEAWAHRLGRRTWKTDHSHAETKSIGISGSSFEREGGSEASGIGGAESQSLTSRP